MNKGQFISYLEDPQKLSVTDSRLLADIVKAFPYFQTAHLLYAKSLHNIESIHYNNQLKTTAAYATNRKVLHSLITNKVTKEFEQVAEPLINTKLEEVIENKKAEAAVHELIKEEVDEKLIQPEIIEIKEEIQPELSVNEVVKQELIEELVIEKITEQLTNNKVETTPVEIPEVEPIVEPEIEQQPVLSLKEILEKETTEETKLELSDLEKEYISTAADTAVEIEMLSGNIEPAESDFVLNHPQPDPVEEKKEAKQVIDIEALTFTDWLKNISSEETELKAEEEEKNPSKPLSPLDLIDKFIKEEPKIARPKADFYNPVNMAKQSVADDITFVSETLAKIYVLQGNYTKAIQAYENLRLKYPEKRLYFASQIKNLRKLINQQKQ